VYEAGQSEVNGVLESLKSAEWLYKAIGESIDYGVWVCDATGRNLYASESFLRLVGMTQEQCSGYGWGDVLHPEDAERTITAWRECVRTGGNWDIEHRFKGTDGRYHAVLARGTPVRGPDGRILCWAGINLDIDERRRAEDRLRETDRRKDEFLATLAHELRNPLAPIRNAAHAIRLKAAGDAQIQRLQEIIDRQVDHLSRLVDDLLDISRITHDKIEVRKEPIALGDCVEYAIEVTRPLVDARRHVLTFEAEAAPVWIVGDAARISQSIANLLGNAAKFTEPGGRVHVHLGREGDSAVVRVTDDGIGMPQDLQERIFDLFVQGDQSLDRAQGGLGLGLSLVRRLVHLHGGTVSAASEGAGRGSRFEIRLPLAEAPRQELAREPRALHRSAPRRVLVVDDNRDVAESTAEVIRHARHEVKTAYSGPAALGVARVFRPEVVFLDIGLPGMDGYEIARRLREFPETAGSCLVALTGYGQAENRLRSGDSGFDEHLVKPADPVALVEIVARAPAAGGPRA
jgi:two-component system CheB/CheR fusion protein